MPVCMQVIMDTVTALVDSGQRVVLQSPEYPPLRNVIAWRGGKIMQWRPSSSETGALEWDLAATDDADVVVATLPHSPYSWNPSEAWLRRLCTRADERGQTLIVDEIYRGIDLTTDGSGLLPSACELSEKAVVFGGLAKTYGLTGHRASGLMMYMLSMCSLVQLVSHCFCYISILTSTMSMHMFVQVSE